MTRKIGEIFKYNGEWYQCLKSNGTCVDCAGFTKYYDFCYGFDGCTGRIFKKIHKTGEPFSDYCPDGRIIYFQRYECYQEPIIEGDIIWHWVDPTLVDIEIKQNKEDMEEKKLNLKPFDLDKAKAGKQVCTRDGRKARIICFDRKLFFKKVSYPILALVERSDGEDDVCAYNEKGRVLIEDDLEFKDDLMMIPEKREGWIVVSKNATIYDSLEDVKKSFDSDNDLGICKIEYEE